jgi:hypothetical protein
MTEYLLKRAVRGLLSAPVVDRPKYGQGVPIDRWLCGGRRPAIHDVLLCVRGWHGQVRSLLVLELRHPTFVSRRPDAGTAVLAP